MENRRAEGGGQKEMKERKRTRKNERGGKGNKKEIEAEVKEKENGKKVRSRRGSRRRKR